jgi:hypothetical protein
MQYCVQSTDTLCIICNFFRYLADKIRAAMFSEYAASYARVTGQDVILIPRGGEEFRAGAYFLY